MRNQSQTSNILIVILLLVIQSSCSSYISESNQADCNGGFKVYPSFSTEPGIYFCHKNSTGCEVENLIKYPLTPLVDEGITIASGGTLFWLPEESRKLFDKNYNDNIYDFSKAFFNAVKNYGKPESYKVCKSNDAHVQDTTTAAAPHDDTTATHQTWVYVVGGLLAMLVTMLVSAGVYVVYTWGGEDNTYAIRLREVRERRGNTGSVVSRSILKKRPDDETVESEDNKQTEVSSSEFESCVDSTD